jgi:molybdopterin-containing oxidoreductase family iron-sulfur binding subunit
MKDKLKISPSPPLIRGENNEANGNSRELWLPSGAEAAAEVLSRRRFMQLMGGSLALAGLAGCRRPVEKIVPYLATPEEVILGLPNYYATTMPLGMDVYGLVVESHEGRPTKIEGNPLHPSTPRGSNSFMQASVLGLYDPDRSRDILHNGKQEDWAAFVQFWQGLEVKYQANGGEGLAVLSESFSTPTLSRLRETFLRRFPKAQWIAYDPISDENIFEGIRIATGQALRPVYHFDKAKVVLALEADFLGLESNNVRHASDFALGRTVRSSQDEMNRLYVVESCASITGGLADHRLVVLSSQIKQFTSDVVQELQHNWVGVFEPALTESSGSRSSNDFRDSLIKDLLANRTQSLVIAGRRQPPEVHAFVTAMNQALGNVGFGVTYHPIDHALPSNWAALAELAVKMKSQEITMLVMLGGNPVYSAPVDLDFGSALAKVENSVHVSLHQDETSKASKWHLNQAHFLESWGDTQYRDGTLSVIQPMIEPLHRGKSVVEVANLLATGQDQSGYDLVRETWKEFLLPLNYENQWRKVLHDGLLNFSVSEQISLQVNGSAIADFLKVHPFSATAERGESLEAVFLPSAAVWDGRFANNAWQQELPDPLTKITWDNAAAISPNLARDLKVETGDVVVLTLGGRSIETPVWVDPAQADGSVALTLGYGRASAGQVGNGVGGNVYRLRRNTAPDVDQGLTLTRTGKTWKLALSQTQRTQADRPVVRHVSLEKFREDPHCIKEMEETPNLQSLWKEHSYAQGYQWGMAIDLTLCTGCSACMTACRAENNVAVVGKEQVHKGRIMHWLRVDNYFVEENGQIWMAQQPVPCMHCEMAPCEQVCPVAATVHDSEGLNLMTYNRCVGTRYCSNNCPYKVRRFNYYNFTKHYPSLLKMVQNPDVTVRSRGVMEKCSYCLQRINRARFIAKQENRAIRDGEVIPACSQACPTGAIVFGDLNDPSSKVVELKKQAQEYKMLAQYNTRPRTSYLAKLRNP